MILTIAPIKHAHVVLFSHQTIADMVKISLSNQCITSRCIEIDIMGKRNLVGTCPQSLLYSVYVMQDPYSFMRNFRQFWLIVVFFSDKLWRTKCLYIWHKSVCYFFVLIVKVFTIFHPKFLYIKSTFFFQNRIM